MTGVVQRHPLEAAVPFLPMALGRVAVNFEREARKLACLLHDCQFLAQANPAVVGRELSEVERKIRQTLSVAFHQQFCPSEKCWLLLTSEPISVENTKIVQILECKNGEWISIFQKCNCSTIIDQFWDKNLLAQTRPFVATILPWPTAGSALFGQRPDKTAWTIA